MDYDDVPQPAGSGTGEQEALGGFRDRVFSPAGLPPVSSSLCSLFGAPGGMSGPAHYPFCWSSFGTGIRDADDITVFVSNRLNIKAMKKALARYEQIAGAKINFDKNQGLQLSEWRGGITLPGPFRWSDGPIRTLG